MKKRILQLTLILGLGLTYSVGLSQILSMPLDNNTDDISGHNNNGIIQGNVTTANDRDGMPNKAYHFAGTSNDYIYIPTNVTSFDFNIVQADSISISLWAQPENNWSEQFIFAKREANWANFQPSDFDIQMGQGARISSNLSLSYYADNNDYYSTTPTNWYHLVLTFANGLSQLYVNDTLRTTSTSALIDSSASTIIIGQNYQGEIDDINVYHRFLNAAEVDQLFRTGTITNVKQATLNADFTIYPNPTNSVINLYNLADFSELSIIDITGHKLQSIVVEKDNLTLDISKYDCGIYIVESVSKRGTVARRRISKTY